MADKKFIVLVALLLIAVFIWMVDFSKFNLSDFARSGREGKIVYAYEPVIGGKLEARCMEIYMIDPSGRRKKRLTHNNFYDNMPNLSPDGKKIVFMSARKELKDYAALSHQIYIMDSDGKNEKQLTFTKGNSMQPSWMPDGKRILFRTQGNRGITGKYRWCIMNADGSNIQTLDEYLGFHIPGVPYFSPDGSKIAYMSSGIWIINRDGTGRRQLTHGGCGATLAWSPDGEKIAFIWYEKTGQGYFGPIHKPYLKIIDVNTGKIESFALKHGLQHLSFSPCGKWLVGSGFGALYKVNIETKREKRIIGRPRIGHKCPQYYWPDWR